MKLFDPNFLSFDGTPIPGRVPARVEVEGGVELTQLQQAGVSAAYKIFCDAKRLSLIDYHTRQYELDDGTRVSMVSIHGVDQVRVAPPPSNAPVNVDFLFFGVPSNLAHSYQEGITALGPSAKWRLSAAAAMPAELKPVGALAASLPYTGHPGHTTWSSSEFTIDREQVVLAWKGPRSRYATTSGWSTSTGGTVVAHGVSGTDAGTNLFTDSQYLWINGRRVDTGIQKIIAACFFRQEDGSVVLRVCTDQYPNPGTARAVAVYDLVASDGASGSSLKSLVKAQALYIKTSYVPSDYSNAPASDGQWNLVQRPHFNKLGTKLASVIQLNVSGTNGTFGAVFNATTWAIVQRIDTPTSDSIDRGGTVTDTGSGGSEVTEVVTTTSETHSATYLIAVDFLDDSVVYVTYEAASSNDYSNDSTRAGDLTETTSASGSKSMQVTHSIIGVLHSFSYATSLSSSCTVSGSSSATITSGADYNLAISFVGDLSRDVFALGYSDGEVFSGVSGSGTPTARTDGHFGYLLGVTSTSYGVRVLYDVYFGGNLVATATTGSFTNAAPSSTSGSGSEVVATAAADNWRFDGTSPPVSSTSSSTDGFGGMAYPLLNLQEYLHASSDARRTVAYLGISHQDSGLEAAIFKTAPTTYTVGAVPAYAGGTRPTVMAPVFVGAVAKGTP